MSANVMLRGLSTGVLLERLLELGLVLAAGYVLVYSFAGLNF